MLKEIIEAVDAKEDKEVIKKFKKLFEEAYRYGDRNFESDWGNDSVLYSMKETMDYIDQLKAK